MHLLPSKSEPKERPLDPGVMGLSVRQIERLTGIVRGIIQKCPPPFARS